jgi:hypothetical protein
MSSASVTGASPFADPSAPMAPVDGTVIPTSSAAVSWAAVVAGAVVAAAISALLIALGAGLGLAVKPSARPGMAIAAFSVWAGIWLIVTQWIASLVGGYLTGRLRTRWRGTHEHEVFFRDTAHGLLAWALSTLLVAAVAAGLVAMAAGKVSHGGSDEGLRVAEASPFAYQVDRLFRAPTPDDGVLAPDARAEASRILASTATRPLIDNDDRNYLIAMVSRRTGLDAPSATTRVDLVLNQVRQDAKTARKAASATGIFTALSMLIGAFIAAVAAVVGGRLRDEHA